MKERVTNPDSLDPISIAILQNALRSIADEAYLALMKSAYSTNIKERHDHSIIVMDAKGRIVAQAERALPGHVGAALGVLEAIYERYDESEILPGDIFITNDPYKGGTTHLPDVNIVKPYFVDGRFLGLICTLAHHADIGGAAPGSMSSHLTNLYQEGIRIPAMKLMREGELDKDVFDLILANIRIPIERRGDYFAQIAACNLGERRMQELAQSYSAGVLEAAYEEIISRTAVRIEAALRRIPDGVYRFEDVMDDDGFGAVNIPLKLEVRVKNGYPTFDFTGCAPQVTGNINCTFNATKRVVAYVLKALLDPDIPTNQGMFDCFDVIAEDSTIVNSTFPAAVANRSQTSQRVADMVIGALAPALPDRATGCSHGTTVLAGFSGPYSKNPDGYVYFEVVAGGGGARATKDGKHGVMVHVTNTSNLPVEVIEMEYPLFVESYALVENSGGLGKFCGGRGIRRIVRPLEEPCYFEGNGERFKNQPWGVFGGGPGKSGRFYLRHDDGRTEELPGKVAGLAIGKNQSIVIEAPGGGGYGPFSERSHDGLERDVRAGNYTETYLEIAVPDRFGPASREE